MSAPGEAVIEARGISKHFGGVNALREVDFKLTAGVIHGLVGANGAGKSTLAGVMTGRVQPDAGEVPIQGNSVHLRHPKDALRLGVVSVPQELAVPAEMTVAQFITLGAEPCIAGFVVRRREQRAASAALNRLGLDIPLGVSVGSLLPSAQKSVVVAQALHRDASAIVLDEPTAGMNADHAAHILKLAHSLRRERVAVLYISHRLEEVAALCDVVTVIRDGVQVAELTGRDVHHATLVGLMMNDQADIGSAAGSGKDRSPYESRTSETRPTTRLVVDRLSGTRVSEVSLAAEPGEMLGLAGLPGSGVEDVFGALAGTAPPIGGRVLVDGHLVTSPRKAMRAGIGYLPPSRASVVLLDSRVVDNIVLTSLPRAAAYGLLTRGKELRRAQPVAERLGVLSALRRVMSHLSGGNQQRVLFGRLLLGGGRVLVFEDPTVGVDVVARQTLHNLIREFAEEGRICILGSSEPEELAQLCRKVLVFRDGSIAAILEQPELSTHRILLEMTGGDELELARRLDNAEVAHDDATSA